MTLVKLWENTKRNCCHIFTYNLGWKIFLSVRSLCVKILCLQLNVIPAQTGPKMLISDICIRDIVCCKLQKKSHLHWKIWAEKTGNVFFVNQTVLQKNGNLGVLLPCLYTNRILYIEIVLHSMAFMTQNKIMGHIFWNFKIN